MTNRRQPGKKPQITPGPLEIGLLCYPEATLSAIHGLTDLFFIASRMARQVAGDDAQQLRISHWRCDSADGEPERCFDTHPGLEGTPAILILPPSLAQEMLAFEGVNRYVAWLKQQHAQGTALCSVCGGAFLLAETGLLDRRVATTHWICAGELAQRYPNVRVDADRLIVDDGDIITAGGLLAWADLGLKLVDRFLGPSITVQTARFMLIDPAGREQRHYSNFSPRLNHGDAVILRVQHWLQSKGARDVSVEMMAQQAGLENRTFLRRFSAATGLKPTEYCQHIRIGKAREALEFSNTSIDQIAWNTGYEDPSAFRKVFMKITGLSPGDYRRRFGVSARDSIAAPAAG